MTGAPPVLPVRRGTYREPTVTGILETLGSDLWGADMQARRSELHQVLFISMGGTIEEWRSADARDDGADAMFRAAGVQANAVIEWLGGLAEEARKGKRSAQ